MMGARDWTPSSLEPYVFDLLSGYIPRQLLLSGEILLASAILAAFVTSSRIGPAVEIEDYFDQLKRIAKHLGLTVVAMVAISHFPRDAPAECSAFFFTEAIGAVYLVTTVGIAAQSAILLKYGALFEPERAYVKMLAMDGWRLAIWRRSFQVLLNPLFVDAPRELRADALWDSIQIDAQNRALDRQDDFYVSRYNRNAERFLAARYKAQDRRALLSRCGAIAGCIVLIVGVATTEYLRRKEGV